MSELDDTGASRAVLIEVSHVLGAFHDHLVIVGGWVPELLYPNRGHIGSLDVDFAVGPAAMTGDVYNSLLRLLTNAGYTHQVGPTRFTRTVKGVGAPVKVDLISGEYPAGNRATSIAIDELQISCLRGIDLAFLAFDEILIEGEMPDGVRNKVRVRIVRPEMFILIKAFALAERKKEKDAYDIAFVLENYQPSLAGLAVRIRAHLINGLVQEGLQFLSDKFASVEMVGPVWAAQIAHEQGRDFEQFRRAAYENAKELLRHLGH